jgi:hypothetical protein
MSFEERQPKAWRPWTIRWTLTAAWNKAPSRNLRVSDKQADLMLHARTLRSFRK